jgi:hypothetical protein
VIQSIQNGPYKNIYNPENFFVGKQGIGAGNNWAAGYATGEGVLDEIIEMIDREADGSDSLEVSLNQRYKLEANFERGSCCYIQLLEEQVLV